MKNMRLRLLVSLCTVILVAGSVHAANYYVAPYGARDGDGSRDRPWPTVAHALSVVGGGQTIVVMAGLYESIDIMETAGGTPERPTVIRSDVRWAATVEATGEHGIRVQSGAEWVVLDGFQVRGAKQTGIYLVAPHVTVRHCWVHHNATHGVGAFSLDYTVIEDNIIEYNGLDAQFHHGIYADGRYLQVRNNTVRFNAAYGIHLYPSATKAIVIGNLVYGHIARGGVIVQSPDGGGQNVLTNNTVVGNYSGITLRRGNAETVANNILTDDQSRPLLLEDGTRNTRSSHNLTTGDPGFAAPENVADAIAKVRTTRVTGKRADVDTAPATMTAFDLKPTSPCLDTGDSAYVQVGALDLLGRPRILGDRVDIGAIEAVRVRVFTLSDVGRAVEIASGLTLATVEDLFRLHPESGSNAPIALNDALAKACLIPEV